ncbi:MAG: acetamidase/formamidase family protein [Anaerolineae bacterium]
MAHHILRPERRTLHGHFSPDLPPVLTIAPGDTVRCSTLDANWGLEPYKGGVYGPRREFEGRAAGLDDGHPLIGPIAISGAQPGLTLAVDILHLRPGTWGFTMGGGWPNPTNNRLGISTGGVVHDWRLDPDIMTGRNHVGHSVRLRAFMGVMGMPPPAPGIHSTIPPRVWGGNMDCKELVVGSTLYLPIPVAGGLFSVGDGHAAQGDGEISSTAIECPMEEVDLRFDLREDFPVTTPVANTPAGWVTMAFDADLNEAAFAALEAMLALMGRLYKLERFDAVALASVVVDLRVTQMVNEVCGVHAVLPHGSIR